MKEYNNKKSLSLYDIRGTDALNTKAAEIDIVSQSFQSKENNLSTISFLLITLSIYICITTMKNIWRLNTFHSYLMRDNSSNEFLCWNGSHSNKHERLFASQLLPNLLSSSSNPSPPTSTGEGEEQSTITSTPTIAVYEEGKEGEKFWEKMMTNGNNNKEYYSTASKLRGEPRLFLISIGSGTVKVNNIYDDIIYL